MGGKKYAGSTAVAGEAMQDCPVQSYLVALNLFLHLDLGGARARRNLPKSFFLSDVHTPSSISSLFSNMCKHTEGSNCQRLVESKHTLSLYAKLRRHRAS